MPTPSQPQLRWARFGRGNLDHLLLPSDNSAPHRTACGLLLPAGALRSNRARHACPTCEARHPERAELVDRMLDFVYQTPQFSIHTTHKASAQPISAWDFDGIEPFVEAPLTHGSDQVQAAEPEHIAWPPDISAIIPVKDGSEPDLQRFRGLRPSETRGRFAPPLPYACELISASPLNRRAVRSYLGRIGPYRWRFIETDSFRAVNQADRGEHRDDLPTKIALLFLGIARARRSQWRVYLGLDGRPGISLPTTPLGAREVFRLRDIPEGKNQRAAIRHWVNEFWRTSRADPDEELLVREHLRGQLQWTWHGLRCKIMPSEVDRARDQQSKADRRAAHLAGTDRRARQTATQS